MIHLFLIVNRSCQTRFVKYYSEVKDRATFESEVAKTCFTRQGNQCLFFSIKDMKIVYRHYGSLCFIIGCNKEDNEFSLLELIQLCVETMDEYFEKVTELDLLFNLQKVHMILDEIIVKGSIVETNHDRILIPIYAITN
ncbi:AP complex, mu/sigma subunit [Pilobolus umbonatus]|nr:AP complex, mu/sigma subunit [Pilobolus umbonatus]